MSNRDLFVALSGTDWHGKALCATVPLDVRSEFVRDWYDSRTPHPSWEDALSLCRRCPVLRKCRDWNDERENMSTTSGNLAGIFGAELPRQRTQRRSKYKERVKARQEQGKLRNASK